MLPALVAFALVLWLGTKAIAKGGGWATAFVLVGLLLSIPAFLLIVVLPLPLALFLFLLVPLTCRSRLTNPSTRSLVVAAAAFGAACVTGWMTFEDQRQLASFRKEFPFQAVNERLTNAPRWGEAISDEAKRRLDQIEKQIQKKSSWDFHPDLSVRSYVLKQLHEETVRTFVNSPGFGQGRMDLRPNRYFLNFRRRKNSPIVQRHPHSFSAEAAESERWQPTSQALELDELHRESVVDFANPDGFGYVKDREHVAGFQSHQFGEKPRGTVATVELVGLLLHPEPVVYVSPHLPNMEELRGAPTRGLDRFEAAGLEAIQKGEDLFVGQTPSGTRMMGAIRSAKQCLQCHEGKRGDLLGAFSYRLEANPK